MAKLLHCSKEKIETVRTRVKSQKLLHWQKQYRQPRIFLRVITIIIFEREKFK